MTEKSVVSSSKSGSKQSYIIQEKTGFEKLSAEIKDSVFQVLYLILKEEDDSLLGFFIGMGADYLQMAAFAFDNQVNSVWKASDLLQLVFQVFSFFQLQTYFSEAFTFTNYLITFYIMIFFIVLMLINILYVSIAFSKKRVSAIWPVMVLRSVTGVFFTVFFLPITEILISMVQCTYNQAGQYVHSNYSEILCWQGTHIIHATIAIFVVFIFGLIGFIVALAYFEIRMLTEDVTARQHSRGDVVFISNKILLQLSFSFFGQDFQWLLVLIIFAGACVLWSSFNLGEPYYRKEATLFFKIITTYYLWTSLLLFLSKLLEEATFDGGLMVWFIGLPFIGVIMGTSQKSNSHRLAQGTAKFKTSSDLMDHLRYLLQLVDIYDTDKNARILLTGYVEKHKDTCDEADCPLKQKKKKRASVGSEGGEMSLGLTLVVDRMYMAGIRKFKSSAKLRIAYAVFLIERMKNTKKAEQQLLKARELNPNFEDQFVIFRLTKMISDGMEGVDVVGLIAWENYKNLYQDFVKESANLHKEFWSELREDTPNLGKLSYLGSRVNTAMSYANEYWSKVQKVRQDDPTILKTYGRFLIDIQSDAVEGLDLIEKARKLVKKRSNHQYTRRNSFDAGLDTLPYVEVAGSGDLDMGKIKQANPRFTILVGANKEEILDKKINVYMPELYGTYHDAFMKRYHDRDDDEEDIGYLGKENELFVRQKIGYIQPVTIRVSRIKTEETTQQVLFAAWFKTDTIKKTFIHILTSKDGTIIDISANAYTILNIALKDLKRIKMSIEKFVPNALTDKGYRKPGKLITYKFSETVTYIFTATVTPIVLKAPKNKEFVAVYAAQYPDKVLNDMSYGYTIKLEKMEKSTEHANTNKLESSKMSSDKRKKKGTGFSDLGRASSFKSNRSRLSRVDDLGNSPNPKQENDGQIISGFNTDYPELEISELFQNDRGVKLDIDQLVKQEDEVVREQIDYGEGISLKKYQKGRLFDIHFESEDAPVNLDDDDEEGSLFNRKDDDEMDPRIKKKRKDKLSSLKRLVKDALEANQRNSAVNPIRILTMVWLVMVFIISILQFSILSQLFADYENKLHVVRVLTQRLTEIDNINSYIIDFMVFDAFPGLTPLKSDYNKTIRNIQLQESVNRIVNLTKELEDATLYSFVEPYITDNVPITIFGNVTNEQFGFNETESLLFIAARAHNIMEMYEGKFDTNNAEVLNIVFNFYDRILPVYRTTANQLQSGLENDLTTFEYQFILLFSINAVISLVISVWGMMRLLVIDQQKEDILFLFLEIPLSRVDMISRKRDKFIEFFDSAIRQLQNNPEEGGPKDDNSDSDESFDEKKNMNENNDKEKQSVFDASLKDGVFRSQNSDTLEEEEDAVKERKKLIKKFKAKKFVQARRGFIKVIILVIVSLLYSISNAIAIVINKNEILQYSKAFFTSNLLSDSILSTININRLMRLDPDYQVLEEDAAVAGKDALLDLNSLGSELGDFFLFVIYKDNDLEAEVTKLFFGNACSFISDPTREEACEESLSKALLLGIFNLKEQVFKILMDEYNIFQNTGATTQDDQLQLLELNDDFKAYAYQILLQFNLNEETFLTQILDNATELQKILLIVYLVVMTLAVGVIWMPYLSRLNAEVWRTTRMINMIPLDMVNSILTIKRFLKDLVRKTGD